jgi:hypothetical protein
VDAGMGSCAEADPAASIATRAAPSGTVRPGTFPYLVVDSCRNVLTRIYGLLVGPKKGPG